jgi:hypothetical protein
MGQQTLGEADPGGLGACPQKNSTLSQFLFFQKRSKSVGSASQKAMGIQTSEGIWGPHQLAEWTILFHINGNKNCSGRCYLGLSLESIMAYSEFESISFITLRLSSISHFQIDPGIWGLASRKQLIE